MNLLPKTSHEFAQKEYWNNFFKKRGKKAFEWYGEYPELCGQLHKYAKSQDNILVVGCGNSKLSSDLYDVGYRNIVNIDISHIVIKQMRDTNLFERPDMVFQQMDATKMSFKDEQFSVVLDKGTLDALMTDDTNDTKEKVLEYFSEVCRVLRVGGRFICISLLQEHIIKELIEYFPKNNFMFRVVRCFEAEQKTAETSSDGTSMPVFIVITTKFKELPRQILEMCLCGDKIQRVSTCEEILSTISATQKAALVCNGLSKGSIAGHNEISLDLYTPDNDVPRFTVHVLDQASIRNNGKYAAFIVPQGRETEWLFSTKEGRKKLLASAHYDRLAIVSMHRGHVYTTWDSVKDELSHSIKNLSPQGVKDNIPYLSLGSEVGQREIIYKGQSELSGDYIIEEISGQDGKIFRRLIFLNNQFVIQSEALVKIVKTKNNQEKKVIDIGYLACQHHVYMAVGVQMVLRHLNNKSKDTLVIGLGGGGLCTFMHKCLSAANIIAIDIDAAMLTVATDFFDLKQDNRLNVFIEDGIAYLDKAAKNNKTFNTILFDVDSKNTSLGMSCPPAAFLDADVLENVKKCIGDTGIFILNLVCRDDNLRDICVKNLKTIFLYICSYKLDEDVNEILYCSNHMDYNSIEKWNKLLEQSGNDINLFSKKKKLSSVDIIDVYDFIHDLKLL